MRTKKSSPAISVCIPVYKTEMLLAQCLRSVLTQNFADFEVIIVSDASDGTDEKGRTAKKIVKLVQKECARIRKNQNLPPISVRFYEHRENRGIFEVRRTLAYEAKGLYITHCDSDDELEPCALSELYTAATETGADIVHGKSTAGAFDEDGAFIPAKENRYGTIYYGLLHGREIFRHWIICKELTANLWGKLIKRDLFLQAYGEIPYTECNLADDALLFFFLSQFARLYAGIPQKVYRYRVNSGMSSGRKIDSLSAWKMSCSAASVFGVISTWSQEQIENITPHALASDELEAVKALARSYIANNLIQLRESVVPALQPAAREMLCDYWGEDFVVEAESALANRL